VGLLSLLRTPYSKQEHDFNWDNTIKDGFVKAVSRNWASSKVAQS